MYKYPFPTTALSNPPPKQGIPTGIQLQDTFPQYLGEPDYESSAPPLTQPVSPTDKPSEYKPSECESNPGPMSSSQIPLPSTFLQCQGDSDSQPMSSPQGISSTDKPSECESNPRPVSPSRIPLPSMPLQCQSDSDFPPMSSPQPVSPTNKPSECVSPTDKPSECERDPGPMSPSWIRLPSTPLQCQSDSDPQPMSSPQGISPTDKSSECESDSGLQDIQGTPPSLHTSIPTPTLFGAGAWSHVLHSYSRSTTLYILSPKFVGGLNLPLALGDPSPVNESSAPPLSQLVSPEDPAPASSSWSRLPSPLLQCQGDSDSQPMSSPHRISLEKPLECESNSGPMSPSLTPLPSTPLQCQCNCDPEARSSLSSLQGPLPAPTRLRIYSWIPEWEFLDDPDLANQSSANESSGDSEPQLVSTSQHSPHSAHFPLGINPEHPGVLHLSCECGYFTTGATVIPSIQASQPNTPDKAAIARAVETILTDMFGALADLDAQVHTLRQLLQGQIFQVSYLSSEV
ncbi:hypothetical protein C7212DRAFT_348175 [Tuber magnatum]|uniref:Uncharacterized protein n=1 Tax=Tuber magnatum TaxID=42249 RepID=A0A317SFT9_9PEZI|nr:hypothetical protein C7212DRAFT_348175 [Tuber magnatum]